MTKLTNQQLDKQEYKDMQEDKESVAKFLVPAIFALTGALLSQCISCVGTNRNQEIKMINENRIDSVSKFIGQHTAVLSYLELKDEALINQYYYEQRVKILGPKSSEIDKQNFLFFQSQAVEMHKLLIAAISNRYEFAIRANIVAKGQSDIINFINNSLGPQKISLPPLEDCRTIEELNIYRQKTLNAHQEKINAQLALSKPYFDQLMAYFQK